MAGASKEPPHQKLHRALQKHAASQKRIKEHAAQLAADRDQAQAEIHAVIARETSTPPQANAGASEAP